MKESTILRRIGIWKRIKSGESISSVAKEMGLSRRRIAELYSYGKRAAATEFRKKYPHISIELEEHPWSEPRPWWFFKSNEAETIEWHYLSRIKINEWRNFEKWSNQDVYLWPERAEQFWAIRNGLAGRVEVTK